MEENGTQFTGEKLKKCDALKDHRQQFDDLEGAFLAIAATLAMARLIYWLQLSPKIGPVVINIRRIILGTK